MRTVIAIAAAATAIVATSALGLDVNTVVAGVAWK